MVSLLKSFLLPLEVKNEKRPGKLPAVSRGIAATATKLFQPYLIASQAGRLEVVVFHRAGAETVAAANG